MSLDQITAIEVALMALPATSFPIIYATRRWYSTQQGRAVMILATGMALLVDFSLLYRLVPTMPGLDVIKVVVFSLLLVAFVWLNVALLSVGRRYRRPPADL